MQMWYSCPPCSFKLDKVLYPFPASRDTPNFFATVDIPFINSTISLSEAFELKSSKSIYFPFGITKA